MDDRRKKLGNRIQRDRRSAGFKSARAFAEAIGSTRDTITRAENGYATVGADTFTRIENGLGYIEGSTIHYLDSGDESDLPVAGAREAAARARLQQLYDPETGEIDPVDAVRTVIDLIPGIRRRLGDGPADDLWDKAMQLAVSWRVLDQVASELQDAKQM